MEIIFKYENGWFTDYQEQFATVWSAAHSGQYPELNTVMTAFYEYAAKCYNSDKLEVRDVRVTPKPDQFGNHFYALICYDGRHLTELAANADGSKVQCYID
jgi:hypothetical protein